MYIIVVCRDQINPIILMHMHMHLIMIMIIIIITIIIRWRIEIPVPLMAATCGVPAQESLNNW